MVLPRWQGPRKEPDPNVDVGLPDVSVAPVGVRRSENLTYVLEATIQGAYVDPHDQSDTRAPSAIEVPTSTGDPYRFSCPKVPPPGGMRV